MNFSEISGKSYDDIKSDKKQSFRLCLDSMFFETCF